MAYLFMGRIQTWIDFINKIVGIYATVYATATRPESSFANHNELQENSKGVSLFSEIPKFS